MSSKFRNGVYSVVLSEIPDVNGLAPAIDFGGITRIDAENRTIYVDAQATPPTTSPSTVANSLQPSKVGGVDLTVRSELNNRLQFLCPQEFQVMPEDVIRVKYPSSQRPTVVFTNATGSVNVALNHTQSRVTPAQLPALGQQMERTMRTIASEWIATDSRMIGGVRWVILDNRTQAADTFLRNLMAITSFDNRALIVTFNATAKDEAVWWPVGESIIQSLRLVSR